MAIYKATYCYPLLNSLDIRIVANSAEELIAPYQLLKCKVDSSNKTVTGYKIRIIDGANNQVFPVANNGEGYISPLSELELLSFGGDINTGLNGTLLYIPFFQNYNHNQNQGYNNMALPSRNAIYYVPRYKAHYIIENTTGWTLSSDNNVLSKTNWDGKIEGEAVQEGEYVLVSAASPMGGIWMVYNNGDLHRYKTNSELTNFNIVITNGSHHDTIYQCDGTQYTPISDHSGQWVDIEGNPINLDIDGGTYKWEITLYQGEIEPLSETVNITVGGAPDTVTVERMNYSNLNYEWFDAVLNRGTVLGSTNKRIQIADKPTSIGGGKLPSGTTSSALVLQGKYLQLLDANGRGIADRSYVRSYDATYGHAYPMEDSFQLNWIEQAEKVRFYKHSNSEDSVLANEIVRLATTENIDLYTYEYKQEEVYNQSDAEEVLNNGDQLVYWKPLSKASASGDDFELADADAQYLADNQIDPDPEHPTIPRTWSVDRWVGFDTSKWGYGGGGYQGTFSVNFYNPEGFPELTRQDINVQIVQGYFSNTDWTVSFNESRTILTVNISTINHAGNVSYNSGNAHITFSFTTTNRYYKYIPTEPSATLGLIKVDGYDTKVNDLVLVKNQNYAQENGVYQVGAEGWHRAAGYEDWGSFIGKIIFVQQGAQNKGTNWESLAQPGGNLYKFDSATSGNSPLYFKRESPIVLFSNKTKYGVDLVGAFTVTTGQTPTLLVDGIKFTPGQNVYNTIDNKIYVIDSIEDTLTNVTVLPVVINIGDYLSVVDGEKYGNSVVKIVNTALPGALTPILEPQISYDLSEAYVLKNTTTTTYISPYLGAQAGMAIKLLNGATVTLSGNETKWLKILGIDTTTWCITHGVLTQPMASASLMDNTIPYTYELRSYFKSSDENPFYINENPYLELVGNFTPSIDWCAMTYGSEVASFLQTLIGEGVTTKIVQTQGLYVGGTVGEIERTLQQRAPELKCIYHQFQQSSWESYRWILINYDAEVLQDTGNCYDKELEAAFYGLNNEINFDPNGNVYYAILMVTDEIGNNLLFIIKLIVDPNSAVQADIVFSADFDCSTQSVLLNYQDTTILYPNVDDAANQKSYRYNEANEDLYNNVITWDNSYLVNSSGWVSVKDVSNDYNVPLVDIYTSSAVESYCGLSQSVIHGLNYSHYFLANKNSTDLSAQTLFLEGDETYGDCFYFETELQLNKNYCGEFIKLKVEGDTSNSYLSIALSLPDNFTNPGTSLDPTELNVDRNQINLILEGYNGSTVTKGTYLRGSSSDTPLTWCSPKVIGSGLKYILQPESVTEDTTKEYEPIAISYDNKSWYLWYKPVKKASGSVQYYLNSKKPLGNLCLFNSANNNGPAYWSETRGTLYFYPNTNNMIDGLTSGEGINLVNVKENVGKELAQNIPTWPSGTDEDNLLWDESGIVNNDCPVKWDEVGAETTAMSKWKPMNRHPDSELAASTWRVIIKMHHTEVIWSDLVDHSGSNITFASDAESQDTTVIKYANEIYGYVIFKQIS